MTKVISFLIFAISIATLPAPAAEMRFGYHVAEADVEGDRMGDVPKLLKACGYKALKVRTVNKAELEPELQKFGGVIIAYVEKGWTHIFDGTYKILNYEKVWKEYSRTRRIKTILWCVEDTTDADLLVVFDHGKTLRRVDAVDGKVKESGKRLPEEHGNWKDSGAENVMDVVGRLGAPFTLYDGKGPFTVFDVR